MKKQLCLLILIIATVAAASGCDDNKSNQYGTITVGNPGSKLHESKLGLNIRYSERLSLTEDIRKGFLQLDNAKLIHSEQEERLSYLRVQALQSPADAKKKVTNLSDLERFVRERFPSEDLIAKSSYANGAVGVKISYPRSTDKGQEDEFILLQDQTLLHTEVRAYREAEGLDLIGAAYRSTQYQPGSNGLGGMAGIEEEDVEEEKKESLIRTTIQIIFLWPDLTYSPPDAVYSVRLFAKRSQDFYGFRFDGIGEGVEIQPKGLIFDTRKGNKLDVSFSKELPPGEYIITKIILTAEESYILEAGPELDFYYLYGPGIEFERTSTPVIRFEPEGLPLVEESMPQVEEDSGS